MYNQLRSSENPLKFRRQLNAQPNDLFSVLVLEMY